MAITLTIQLTLSVFRKVSRDLAKKWESMGFIQQPQFIQQIRITCLLCAKPIYQKP